MGRMRTPTRTNLYASETMIRDLAKKIVERDQAALVAVQRLATTVPLVVSERQVLSALAKVRDARRDLDRLQFDLLGACVLAGAQVGTISDNTGIKPAVLTRRLPHTPAALVGREIVRDVRAPYGWTEA